MTVDTTQYWESIKALDTVEYGTPVIPHDLLRLLGISRTPGRLYQESVHAFSTPVGLAGTLSDPKTLTPVIQIHSPSGAAHVKHQSLNNGQSFQTDNDTLTGPLQIMFDTWCDSVRVKNNHPSNMLAFQLITTGDPSQGISGTIPSLEWFVLDPLEPVTMDVNARGIFLAGWPFVAGAFRYRVWPMWSP